MGNLCSRKAYNNRSHKKKIHKKKLYRQALHQWNGAKYKDYKK